MVWEKVGSDMVVGLLGFDPGICVTSTLYTAFGHLSTPFSPFSLYLLFSYTIRVLAGILGVCGCSLVSQY